MNSGTLKTLLTCAALATLAATSSAFAQGGGNGNGGGGGGGSHGSATAGMTYHSEPVDSLWNPDPARMNHGVSTTRTERDTMPSANDMATKAVQ